MDPQLIARLKRDYILRRPTIVFDTANDGYLGDGSFSITFAARDGRVPCVVKFSKKPWAADPGVKRERQALLERMLQCNGHPHVVALHYYDDNFDGHLITQWEKGDLSLEQRLQACQANGEQGIPRDELLPYMDQAAKGLDFVNGKAIVHRDVKPDNLLLFQGQVKLIDFGFARLAEIASATNSVLGTPVFAPDEASDGRLNPNVDIFCLAGTYIRLRTGEFPFGKGADLKNRKQAGQFHTAGLHSHEIEALNGALDPDPKRRTFGTAGELVAALVVNPPPKTQGPAPAARPPAKSPVNPPAPAMGRSFVDKIRLIVAKEQIDQQTAAEAEAERQAALRSQFEALLHQQFDAKDFALAYGTVNYLLRVEPKNVDFLEARKFLEQPDAKGRARAEDPDGNRFALIPPGEFLMGSPLDENGEDDAEFQHRVRIVQPFYFGIYPVIGGSKSRHPRVNVSWIDAQETCALLSKSTGKSYRLPMEAEWEYGCRAGKSTPYWFGDGITPSQANFGSAKGGTTPVGSYAPNAFGLYDMHGNVWEWCADWYEADYYRKSPLEDPTGPTAGSSRVLRGGGWDFGASFCRSAYRRHSDPACRDGVVGFRVVVVLSVRPSRPG